MKQVTTYFVLFLLFLSPRLQAQDPNIILIIADDMGWSQISSGLTNFGNASDFYETPTLATLASEGIAFPNGYVNGANCAPTRAALLSGQYAARPHNNVFNVYDLNRGNTSGNSTLIGPDMGLPSGIDEIPASAETIAEILQADGYATAHFGKFHVGENSWEAPSANNNAYQQGFDYNFGGGTKGGPGAYHASGGIFHSVIGPELDPYGAPYTAAESTALAVGGYNLEGENKHVQDAMADAAIDFMDFANDYADPTPSADPYIHEVDYASAKPFFMHFSNFAIHGPIGNSHARPDFLDKYQNKTPTSSMGHTNNALGAILEGMDQSIGRIIDYLKVTDDPRRPGHKLSENTLVYFIADNGGAINTQENGPLRAMKGSYYEGGIRSVTLAWSDPTNGLLANPGTVNTTPVIGFDLYPTFAEMAGASLPGGGYDVDGTSLWTLLSAGTAPTRETLFWHFPGYLIDSKRDQRPVTIVRKNGYKLIHNYETADYELYDLDTDLSESTNLLPSSDQAVIDLANDMITDMINHLTDTSAPLPTYRSGGATVPMPTYISASSSNSTDGCQPEAGYEAFWDFDSVSNADDASGNSHNPISVAGTLTYDNSDFQEGDQSVIFDGSTEIEYDDGTFLNDATAARTFAAWIKPTALSGTQEIFEEGGSGNGLALRLNGSNLEARITNNTDPDVTVSTAYPNDGNWHHIAMVFDGANTSLALYIDGLLGNSTSSAFSQLESHSSPGGVGGVIGTGDAFGSAAGDSFFTGKMDALAVYNSVLSLSEVQSSACNAPADSGDPVQPASGYEALWDFDLANDANDASGNDHNPTAAVSGNITYDAVDFKEGDRSVIFDGTAAIQYATNNGTPDNFMNSSTSTRSIVAWIKPTTLSGMQDIYDEGGQNVGIAMRLNGSNLESIVRETSSVATTISAAFPNDGNWHHVALVYNGGSTSHKLYIDGVEVASSSIASSSIASHFSYGGIGGKLSGNDSFKNSSDAFFTGKVDAFAVYNNALSLAEVEESAGLSLSVDNESLQESLKIYPNPFKNKLQVSFKQSQGNVSIQLYDILGKAVLSRKYSGVTTIEVPTNNLTQGFYLLRIKTNAGEVIKKVVKE